MLIASVFAVWGATIGTNPVTDLPRRLRHVHDAAVRRTCYIDNACARSDFAGAAAETTDRAERREPEIGTGAEQHANGDFLAR